MLLKNYLEINLKLLHKALLLIFYSRSQWNKRYYETVCLKLTWTASI